MKPVPSDLVQGTLHMLILKTLALEPMHGYGIATWIEEATDDVLCVEEGSLYPALYRMENKGWIKAEWRLTENNRRAKYYRLTAAGRRRLGEEMASWQRLSDAMSLALRATAQEV